MSDETTPRWRRPIALVAWAAFIAGALTVLFLGTDEFNAQTTHGFLTPILHWLFPDLNPNERYLLHVRIRKTAHLVEYGILALLALWAVLLSLRSAIARRALVALAMVAAVAAVDETRQSFSTARTGSPFDVLLDITGAIIAVSLALWLRRLLNRRKHGTESA